MIITGEHRSKLIEAGNDITRGHWVIGDVANELVQKYCHNDGPNGGVLVEYNTVLREVGKLCGLSWRRVDKIRKVCELFPDHMREPMLAFGYYERAYDFGEDAEAAIDFLFFFNDEYGRIPSMTEFPMLFTQHILGGDVGGKIDPIPEPPEEIIRYIERLRYILLKRYSMDSQVILLLDRLEKALSYDTQAVPS